jgi:3-deoxy-manno-octulosonate cytidylyltransferase (CMP-KDO synthetase)
MYMSRSDIPSDARTPNAPMLKVYHVVPFRKAFLLEYAGWGPGYLESIEFNEYLRILERGHRIRAVQVESSAISVDTPEDLQHVRAQMVSDPLFAVYR